MRVVGEVVFKSSGINLPAQLLMSILQVTSKSLVDWTEGSNSAGPETGCPQLLTNIMYGRHAGLESVNHTMSKVIGIGAALERNEISSGCGTGNSSDQMERALESCLIAEYFSFAWASSSW